MEYGIVMDNRRCIGCRACEAACEAEHAIPPGCSRARVAVADKGVFPDVHRFFTVLFCNHCAQAPCVSICPTEALFRRENGIVDFDSAQCIGCRSCIAACPYGALYMDPKSGTAAKCNLCAHRVELGTAPACVAACPTEAIVAGDLEDHGGAAYRLVSSNRVAVRRPEKGAGPKVFYIGGDLSDPAFSREPSYATVWGRATSMRHWMMLIASGPILLAALLSLTGYARAPFLFGRVAPVAALVGTIFAIFFLLADLERPERFLKAYLFSNFTSWFAWGIWLPFLFSGVILLWLAAGSLGRISPLFLWTGLFFSVTCAVYTEFLSAQARAGALWRSPAQFPHLLVQSFTAGAAILAPASLYFESGVGLTGLLFRCLLGGLCAHAILILGMAIVRPGDRDAEAAADSLIHGPLAFPFWFGAVFSGVAFPILLLSFYFHAPALGLVFPVLAAAASLFGILTLEHCRLRAGVEVRRRPGEARRNEHG